jgi:hypothetical protein
MEELTIKDAIRTVLKGSDIADRPSLFQMQCFVLQKEPTIQGKLHQCLLELKNRDDALEAIELELEEQQDRLELIDIEVERKVSKLGDDSLSEREKVIIKRQADRQKISTINHIDRMARKKKSVEEEAQFWLSAFYQLSKREPIKQWDDPDVQKDYWNEKLRQEVNLRLLLRQLPDMETMRSILALHDDSPLKRKTVEMLQQYNQNIAQIAQKQPTAVEAKAE